MLTNQNAQKSETHGVSPHVRIFFHGGAKNGGGKKEKSKEESNEEEGQEKSD